jgi:hypothetical protein
MAEALFGGAGMAFTAFPQLTQKRAAGSFATPHWEHRTGGSDATVFASSGCVQNATASPGGRGPADP